MGFFILLNILVNFGIIFYHGFKTVYLVFVKFKKVWKFALYGEEPESQDNSMEEQVLKLGISQEETHKEPQEEVEEEP